MCLMIDKLTDKLTDIEISEAKLKYIYSDSTLQGGIREYLDFDQYFGKVGVINAQS